jgi:phosphotransferase system enzyme I (PtsI)
MKGKLVIIRTLDIGADKQAAYFNLPREENSALGMRAIRICLTRPELFKTQLRAIYRASAFGNTAIMFPMISSLGELQIAKKIAKEVRDELTAQKIPFNENLPLGIMIETPASAIISDLLAKEADFFSIGTNDLTQYTLAVDRENESISQFLDTHHEAIIRLIRMTVENAHKSGIWCGICGMLAADAALTKTFLEMGLDELSVEPSYILELRARIAEL